MAPDLLTPPGFPATLLCLDCGSPHMTCDRREEDGNSTRFFLICADCEAQPVLTVGSVKGTMDIAIARYTLLIK